MPTLSYPKKWTPPRQQTIQYTPPGGVFDADTGAPVESFGAGPGIEPWQMKPARGGQVSGMYDPFGRRRGAFDFGQPNDPGTVWNLTGAPSSTQPVNPAFTLNPQPQSGTGPFGQVPGPLGLPNPYTNLQGPIANLPQLNQAASASILSNLQGELSPATQMAIQDAAARFGISSGMPGSGLAQNRSLRDIGRASEEVRAQGLQQYNPFVSTVSGTQTVRPETQISLAEMNAINASAPNPAAQSSYAEELFNKYLNQINGRNPAGGSGDLGMHQYSYRTGGAAPSGPFAPITAFGNGNRQTWQNLPWQGDNSFAGEIDWSGRKGWLNR